MLPKSSVEAQTLERPRAWRSRAARAPAPRRDRGALRPAPRTCSGPRRWPGCRCRTPRRRQPRRRTSSGGAPDADVGGCCADTTTSVDPDRPQRARGRRRRTARRGRPAHATRGNPGPRGTRPATRRAPASHRSRRRAPRASLAQRPVPWRSSSTSSGDSPRCTVVTASGCASTSARIAWKSAGETEYGACGARLTRTPPLVDARGFRAWREPRATRPFGSAVTEADQLVEHLRRHRQRRAGAAR